MRRTSRPAAGSTRAARWRSIGARSRSRRLFDLGGGQAAACWLVEKDQLPVLDIPVAPPHRRVGRRDRTEPRSRRTRPRRIHRRLADDRRHGRAELVALGDEAGWRPEPGEWSANECVGHLIEAERAGSPAGSGGSCRRPARRPVDLRDWIRRPSPSHGATSCAGGARRRVRCARADSVRLILSLKAAI